MAIVRKPMDRLRHRDLLLSLKYSTIEACFSVPMLNITLPSFPFVLAFVVTGLGWQTATVGVMASLPHVCNFLQPVLMAGLSRRLSRYGLLHLAFSLGAAPWLLSPLLPVLEEQRDLLFTVMLVVSTLVNSIASVAWSSSISELVPERLGGRYFARRNLVFGVWTLVIMLLVGHVAEWSGSSLTMFGWVFFCAGLARLLGLFFLTRMTWPAAVKAQREGGIASADLLSVFGNRNYVWLCMFIGCWGLVLNLAMPFYTVYLVGERGLGLDTVVQLTTLASAGGLLTLQGWGRLCENFGNRPVLQVAALGWAGCALLMWGPWPAGWTWHLYAGYFVVGAMTAGFQLVQFNLMVRLAPGKQRSAYVAVFVALTSALTALGPILGGQVLRLLPDQVGRLFGQPIQSYHLLFLMSALGCMLATYLARRVREEAEQPVLSVWREMQGMRTFNPMLSVLAVGELLLTPRGLVALGQRSWRSVRQQVKGIESVGEELLNGGREIIQRNPPERPTN